MKNPRGFLEAHREKEPERPVAERVRDWEEVARPHDPAALQAQAARCMDCGVPFCHRACPLGNLIPEWNELAAADRWDEATRRLEATNNFPEITARVCPAPCEASCVLALETVAADDGPRTPPGAVAIKAVERAIAERLFAAPLVPRRPAAATGRAVVVVGSGPAGLAAAQELARRGHAVTVFERDDRLGGLLRYGIPDFKLERGVLDRRIAQIAAEGVAFRTGANPGPSELEGFDAVVLALGARRPRDVALPGRDLGGVHFAMDYLTQQNRRVAGLPALGATPGVDAGPEILAAGRHVVVIGGGDTGSDCVGTAVRQGAASVRQLEHKPAPALLRRPDNPWPEWPLVLRTSSSHEEGAERDFAVVTTGFEADPAGRVAALLGVRLAPGASPRARPPVGDPVRLPCDLVLLAMGFAGPEPGLAEALGVAREASGAIVTDPSGATSRPGVFAAGDVVRGQSLVVWAIADGRRVAAGVHAYLGRRRADAPAAFSTAPRAL